jgi:TfoX/Sxy family transcriptional regulator of competence genes
MPWKKANRDLIGLLEKLMRNYDCDRRLMFGSPTFFVNGRMFTGVHQDTIILRLSEPDQREISSEYQDVKPFTPMGTQVMKDYVALPVSVANQETVLRHWMDRSFAYSSSLPPKIAKHPVEKRRSRRSQD